MSVDVNGLVKTFGQQRAVDGLDFSLGSGEIVGFLGPNGAGKSTTMKMITGLLFPTEGSVNVCGYDVSASPVEVRKRIGYLPEHNPLYKDMYIREYLELVAGIHGIPNKKQRVEEMIETTGLTLEAHKQIGALSKGYRQRVGLAQAIIHDPEVLILDEPTSGLDPNQLADIRGLIRKIGEEKTVLFSTHIMQEVQLLCNRVIIINLGKIVADAPIEQLNDRMKGRKLVRVQYKERPNIALIKSINGVIEIEQVGKDSLDIIYSSNIDIREKLFTQAVEQNLVILEMRSEQHDMEDIFHALTKTS